MPGAGILRLDAPRQDGGLPRGDIHRRDVGRTPAAPNRDQRGAVAGQDLGPVEKQLVARTVDDGLYEIEEEHRFSVTDTFDSGREFVEMVSGWQGTRISRALSERVAAARPPVCVHQEVRLRVLRRFMGSNSRF